MAYIVGFILADGCIAIGANKISFCQQQKDRVILEFMAKEFQYSGIIHDLDIFDKRTNKTYYRSSLYFNSKQIKSDLIHIGIQPQKTGKEKMPNIPKKYFYDFLRGYFDGDGTVNLHNKRVSMTCHSPKLLKQIKNIIKMGAITIGKNPSGTNQYTFAVYNIKDRTALYKKLYRDNCFSLARKKEAYKQII